jgi:hypothetical protein
LQRGLPLVLVLREALAIRPLHLARRDIEARECRSLACFSTHDATLLGKMFPGLSFVYQNDIRAIACCKFADSAFKTRKIELVAKDIEKVQALTFQAPRCADAKIRKFGILVCGIPALNDLIELFRLFVGVVEL